MLVFDPDDSSQFVHEPIHDRMPVILGRTDENAWLDPEIHEQEEIVPSTHWSDAETRVRKMASVQPRGFEMAEYVEPEVDWNTNSSSPKVL